MPRPENIMFDMDLQLEYSPKTVKLIDFDTCPGTEPTTIIEAGGRVWHCMQLLGAFFRETFWVGQIKLAWWFERSISLHSGSFLENDMWHHQPATDRFSSRLEMFLSFFSFFFRPFFLVGSFGIDIVSLKLTALRTWKWMIGILYSFLFGAWNGLYSVRNMYGWKMLEDGHFPPIFREQTRWLRFGEGWPTHQSFLAKPSLPYWGQEWTPQTPKSCRFVGTLGVSRNLCPSRGNFLVPSFEGTMDIL